MEDFRKTGKEQYFESVCSNYVRQSLQKQDSPLRNLWWVEISPCPHDSSKRKKKYFERSWLEMKYEEISFEGNFYSQGFKKLLIWGCKLNVANVTKLMQIRKDFQKKALEISLKQQKRQKRAYDRRWNTAEMELRIGVKVQIRGFCSNFENTFWAKTKKVLGKVST